VAIDGAKFKAVNSPNRHYTAEQVQELTRQSDARIEEHLGQLEAADPTTANLLAPPTAAELQAKLATLKEQPDAPRGEPGPAGAGLTDVPIASMTKRRAKHPPRYQQGTKRCSEEEKA